MGRNWVGRCKPDFVPALFPTQVAVISLNAHLAARALCFRSRATNTRGHPSRLRGTCGQAGRSLCYVLHRTGFVLPPSLRSERWALTPPFHPGRAGCPAWWYVFCDTFHDRRLARTSLRVCTRRAALWCPDFPLRFVFPQTTATAPGRPVSTLMMNFELCMMNCRNLHGVENSKFIIHHCASLC